jgi:hypothetical protein
MLLITAYTSYNEIRAALGVSEEEVPDGDLELPTRLTLLEEAITDLHPGLLPLWSTLPDESLRSAEQSRFAKLLSLYATYAVAADLLVTVELFGYQKVADGRASTERSEKAFENLRGNVQGMLKRLGTKLLAALVELAPETVVTADDGMIYVSSTGIVSDPVTV